MPQSSDPVQPIQVDFGKIRSGKVDILVRWDIQAEEREGTVYALYEERRINWVLPAVYESEAAIQSYLDANYSTGENILGWAQASKISAIGT